MTQQIYHSHFNSRPHEEVDAIHARFLLFIYFISTHDLTKRSTLAVQTISQILVFQLTTSRRGRRRPWQAKKCTCAISTHDLTKRSTFIIVFQSDIFPISTHDLTKRSTVKYFAWISVCFIFQLTTSRRGRPRLWNRLIRWPNISTHDLTKRSTSWIASGGIFAIHFNSRPHEEVDKPPLFFILKPSLFQLTTSRRGRPTLWVAS